MKSPQFLKIDRYWQPLKRHWLPGTIVLISVFGLGIIGTLIKKPVYEAQAKLRFKKSDIVASISEVERNIGIISGAKAENTIATEVSVSAIEKTIADLNLRDTRNKPLSIDDFRKNFFVREIIDSSTFEIGYRDSDPQRATKIVNTLVAHLLENNIALDRSEAIAARQFLEKQLSTTEKNLQETEAAIRKIQEDNQFFSTENEAAKVLTALQDVRQKIITAQAQVANTNSQAEYIKKQLGLNFQQAAVVTRIWRSPEIQGIVLELRDLKSELAIEQARSEPNDTNIELERQIKSLQSSLDRRFASIAGFNANLFEGDKYSFQPELASELIRLEADLIGLTDQIVYLTQVERNQETKAQKLPQIEQQLRELNRNLAVSQSTYELLTRQHQAVRIAENLNTGNLRVITYASTPNQLLFPRYAGYLATVGLAVVAALGVVYLLEISDRSIKTIEEAKQLFGYSWLGIIPDVNQLNSTFLPANNIDSLVPELIVKDHPSLFISESYRILLSNLKFLSSNQEIKTIVVTSSVSGEGKSTVAANLATAMAQIGNKVLLIDANLHHPMQHHIWNVFKDSGLSNILSERLDSRLRVEEVIPNLDLITSGTATLSPATLLDSQSMKIFIARCTEFYDFIIIDSPAVNVAADVSIMARMADGVLLVVKPGSLNRTEAKFAKEILEKSKPNILGLVFNAVRSDIESQSHYYHALEATKEDQTKRLSGTKEELWDIVSRLAKESRQDRLDSSVTPETLDIVPLEKLSAAIANLERDLSEKTRLVKEQQEEVLMQRQKVKKLENKVNIADEKDLWDWQIQLDRETEIKQMLEKTLSGQLNNLKRKKRDLEQYRRALYSRQNKLSVE